MHARGQMGCLIVLLASHLARAHSIQLPLATTALQRPCILQSRVKMADRWQPYGLWTYGDQAEMISYSYCFGNNDLRVLEDVQLYNSSFAIISKYNISIWFFWVYI